MPQHRSRASARKAGSTFESVIAAYFRATFRDDRIERRVKNGAKDRGDLTGLRMSHRLGNGRIVAELKDVISTALGPWVNEAEKERGNDDALVGLVIHKRMGKAHPGQQFVTMSVDDLCALLTGERPGS